jgi:hypothetical protein
MQTDSIEPNKNNSFSNLLTTEMKLNKLFENIFQVTLDSNYNHASNKYIFIGETDIQTATVALLTPENLDEVNSFIQNCI